MRKELVPYEHGNKKETVFKPAVKTLVKPVIVGAVTRGGIRIYKDSAGREHIADTFDRVWGKSFPSAITPDAKRHYQRHFKK